MPATSTNPSTIAHPQACVIPTRQTSDVDRHFARRGQGEEFEMEVRWIVRFVPPDAKRILDIGCGNGELIARIGLPRAVGIDFSRPGLRQTRHRLPFSRLTCADGAKLPFASNTFDAIIAQHLIEHIPNPAFMLSEWRRVLGPGAAAIVVTPNADFCDPTLFDDPTHARIFDRRTLREAFDQNGFRVEQICTLGCPWFREYKSILGAWRLRQIVLRQAQTISRLPILRWIGQSLCCVARRVPF